MSNITSLAHSFIVALLVTEPLPGLLRAALWFLELRPAPQDTALVAVRSWLNSWTGIGAVAVGMAHQDYDLQLTRYDARGWRATFYTTGIEHSLTSATRSAFEPSPWRATQRAALEALRRLEQMDAR